MADYLLVNRDGTTSQFDMADTAKLQDDDLLLVNRSDTTYTVTGKEIKDSAREPIAPVINSVTLTQNELYPTRFTENSFTSTVDEEGEAYPTAVASISAKVTGALSVASATLPITANTYDGSGAIPLELAGTTNLGDLFTVGTEVQASASYTPVSSEIISASPPASPQSFSSLDRSGDTMPPYRGSYAILFDGNNDGTDISWSNGTTGSATIFELNAAAALIKLEYQTTGSTDFEIWITDKDGINQQVPNPRAPAGSYATIDTTGVDSIKKLTFTGLGNPFGITGIKLNGQLMADNVPVQAGAFLTFEDNTDLGLFQTGDVIGEFGTVLKSVIATSSVGTNWTENTVVDLVNNTIAQNDTSKTPAATNKNWNNQASTTIGDTPAVYTFTPPLELKSNESLWMWYVHQNNDIAQWAGGVNNATTVGPKNWGAAANTGYVMIAKGPRTIDNAWGIRIENTTTITDLIVATNSSYDVGYAVNEAGIPATFNFPEQYFTSVYPGGGIEIISTDPNNNKMVVSGGEWFNYNTSQDWSAGGTGMITRAGYEITNAFNGEVIQTQNPGEAWFTTTENQEAGVNFSGLSDAKSVKIYAWINSGDGFILVNGNAVGYTTTGPVTLTVNVTGTGLNSIDFKYPIGINGIEVDGKLLVDGPWNQSQVWSKDDTGNLFNGDLDSNWLIGGAAGWVTVSDADFTINSSVEIYSSDDAGFVSSLKFGGIQCDVTAPANGGLEWRTVDISPLGGPGTFSGLELIWPYGSLSNGYGGIRIDGNLLVDKGIGGDTEVSTLSAKRGNGTIKSISGANVEIEPFTDNAFVEGQYLISTAPIKVTPVTDAIDSINGNTITFDSSEQLLNFANGDAVTMCNSDGTPASVTYESSEIIDVEPLTAPYSCVSARKNGGGAFHVIGGRYIAYNGWYIEQVAGTMIVTFPNPIPFENECTVYVGNNRPNGLITVVLTSGAVLTTTDGKIDISNQPNGTDITDQGWQVANSPDAISSVSMAGEYGNNTGSYFFGLRIDGVLCNKIGISNSVLGDITYTENKQILTFENNTDLDKFPVGTVVQSSGPIYSELTTTNGLWYANLGPENAFNGIDSSTVYASTGTASQYIEVDLKGLGLTCDQLTVFAYSPQGLYARVNGQQNNTPSDYTQNNGGTPSFVVQTWSTLSASDTLDSIYLAPGTGTNRPGLAYIKISGNMLTDGAKYSVTDDSDIGNNKLTVSGGEWFNYNTSQDWSANATGGTTSEPPSNAFDGNLNTYASRGDGGNLLIPFPSAITVTSLEVLADGAANTMVVTLDGANVNVPGMTGSKAYWSVPINGSALFSQIQVVDKSSALYAIKVNGQILVNGPWNQSQVWSDNISNNNAISPDWVWESAFKGNTGATSANSPKAGLLDSIITFNPPLTDSPSIWAAGGGVSFNAIDSTVQYDDGTGFKSLAIVNTYPDGYPTTEFPVSRIEKIRMTSSTGSNYAMIAAITNGGKILVNKGIGGDKEVSVSYSGTGTVGSVDAPNNQITLTGSNNQWADGYHMTTPEKNAVEKTAYLVLDGLANVTGISAFPQAATPVTATNPVITFPATFDTGNAPDVELPYPTFLQTTVTLTNVLGSDSKDSNELYPVATGGFVAPAAGSSSTLVNEYGEFVCKVQSHEGRAAEARAVTYAENCEALRTAATAAANTFLANNP